MAHILGSVVSWPVHLADLYLCFCLLFCCSFFFSMLVHVHKHLITKCCVILSSFVLHLSFQTCLQLRVWRFLWWRWVLMHLFWLKYKIMYIYSKLICKLNMCESYCCSSGRVAQVVHRRLFIDRSEVWIRALTQWPFSWGDMNFPSVS
jgi:hypothetical protein